MKHKWKSPSLEFLYCKGINFKIILLPHKMEDLSVDWLNYHNLFGDATVTFDSTTSRLKLNGLRYEYGYIGGYNKQGEKCSRNYEPVDVTDLNERLKYFNKFHIDNSRLIRKWKWNWKTWRFERRLLLKGGLYKKVSPILVSKEFFVNDTIEIIDKRKNDNE